MSTRSSTSQWRTRAAALAVLLCVAVSSASAQRGDSARVAPKNPPTLILRGDTTVAPSLRVRAASRLTPPLSPARAFLYSALFPGLGQSRLDRGTSGALFAAIELAAVTLARRSAAELKEARRYEIDTLPSDFVVSGTTITKSGVFTNGFTGDLIKSRQLHLEDWLAAIAFNHLFSGADAFVAAQLWDVPVVLSAVPTRNGAMVLGSVRF